MYICNLISYILSVFQFFEVQLIYIQPNNSFFSVWEIYLETKAFQMVTYNTIKITEERWKPITCSFFYFVIWHLSASLWVIQNFEHYHCSWNVFLMDYVFELKNLCCDIYSPKCYIFVKHFQNADELLAVFNTFHLKIIHLILYISLA